jgi:glycosyltransferase involved in cell wall biosynthesis
MASAVVTVVPSRSEAFGLVNIESMAVGTPVVASKVGGIVEIIRHGVDGFLVPPDNAEALAEKLKVILCNPHVRREMRTSCRQRFLEQFEQRRSVLEQADWHEELANSKTN